MNNRNISAEDNLSALTPHLSKYVEEKTFFTGLKCTNKKNTQLSEPILSFLFKCDKLPIAINKKIKQISEIKKCAKESALGGTLNAILFIMIANGDLMYAAPIFPFFCLLHLSKLKEQLKEIKKENQELQHYHDLHVVASNEMRRHSI